MSFEAAFGCRKIERLNDAMKQARHGKIPSVLNGLSSTWVWRTRAPGVFELSWNLVVRLRGFFLHGGSDDGDKRALVAALARRYPNVMVWVDDWTTDEEARRLLGLPLDVVLSNAHYVLVTDQSRLQALLPRLFMGGWAMIFLAEAPVSIPVPPNAGLPRKAVEFKDFVQSVGGRAAIDSWFDDVSWRVLLG